MHKAVRRRAGAAGRRQRYRRESYSPYLKAAAPRLSNKGYKILVDIFASSPQRLRVAELPYAFRPRHSGESKLEPIVLSEYLFLLADKTVGRILQIGRA